MEGKLIIEIKKTMIDTYKKYGDEKVLTRGRYSYTGNQLANEIENETEVGINMINSILKLTIDLLKRDKINM
jgi:hypothetical protein